ncbi:HNH endonuclease [Arcobacteraceae bacterium]|nr:HNH endonuclease [Arcobacteraceae bacterium]
MKSFSTNIKKEKPYKCILCNSSNEYFTTIEHIVPHSLGNNFLTLDKGWVCDKCNNICSGFESRALNNSSLSFQKVLMGHKTKKGKQPKATYNHIEWFSEKTKKNSISIDLNKKKLNKNPFIKYFVENNTKAFIQLAHNKFDIDISKLLLKIGIEMTCSLSLNNSDNIDNAKKFILNNENESWPFLLIQDKGFQMKSLFGPSKFIHSHALASNFDIFIYENQTDELIFFFSYGYFLYAINLYSKNLNWLEELKNDNFKFVAFPIEFSKFSNT